MTAFFCSKMSHKAIFYKAGSTDKSNGALANMFKIIGSVHNTLIFINAFCKLNIPEMKSRLKSVLTALQHELFEEDYSRKTAICRTD